ncbi:MAG: hypothetical protein AAGF24_05935 [Cyanobacteria bacterium P01_H01_bin.121]
MYLIQIPGFGYVHNLWKTEEPRFCEAVKSAKKWKTLPAALEFGDQQLTYRVNLGWEVWQQQKTALTPIIRPQL